MMKYFTLDGWIADQDLGAFDPESVNRPVREYKAYIESIRDRLPADLQNLLAQFSLHDGRLRSLTLDVAGRTAVVRFDAGDITMREGRDVSLHYGDVSVVESTSDPKRGLPGPHGYGDVGNDEIELFEDGGLEHRFLFSTGIQMRIRFRTFRLVEHT
jgi:hypothetical protein